MERNKRKGAPKTQAEHQMRKKKSPIFATFKTQRFKIGFIFPYLSSIAAISKGKQDSPIRMRDVWSGRGQGRGVRGRDDEDRSQMNPRRRSGRR